MGSHLKPAGTPNVSKSRYGLEKRRLFLTNDTQGSPVKEDRACREGRAGQSLRAPARRGAISASSTRCLEGREMLHSLPHCLSAYPTGLRVSLKGLADDPIKLWRHLWAEAANRRKIKDRRPVGRGIMLSEQPVQRCSQGIQVAAWLWVAPQLFGWRISHPHDNADRLLREENDRQVQQLKVLRWGEEQIGWLHYPEEDGGLAAMEEG